MTEQAYTALKVKREMIKLKDFLNSMNYEDDDTYRFGLTMDQKFLLSQVVITREGIKRNEFNPNEWNDILNHGFFDMQKHLID